MKKILIISFICACVICLFSSCSKKNKKNVYKDNNEKKQEVIDKLVDKIWYAQKETDNAYTGNLAVIFKNNGAFNLYDFEGETECMRGTYMVEDNGKIEFNCKGSVFAPPSIWKCSKKSVFTCNFLSESQIELVYKNVPCRFFLEDEDGTVEKASSRSLKLADAGKETSQMANKGLEGKILDLLNLRTYLNEKEKILLEFLDGELKIYKVNDTKTLFDTNNNVMGKLLYKGKITADEDESEFHYNTTDKTSVIKYDIFKEDVGIIVLEYNKKTYEFKEVYMPLG